MKHSFDRRDEYEQDVFADESPLQRGKKNWDDFDGARQEELEGYDAFDLDDYEREANEEEE
jgi:hypothetical protein